jgi:hypothetical protein
LIGPSTLTPTWLRILACFQKEDVLAKQPLSENMPPFFGSGSIEYAGGNSESVFWLQNGVMESILN